VQSDGSIAWTAETYIAPTQMLLGTDGRIHVTLNSGGYSTYSITLQADGSEQWFANTGYYFGQHNALDQNGRLFGGTYSNIRGLSANDGGFVWGSASFSYPTVTLGANDKIVASRDGQVAAFGLNDGQPIWTWSNAGTNALSAPIITQDGLILAASSDGKLYAINSGIPGLANAPWPQVGHDQQGTGRVSFSSSNHRVVQLSGTVTELNDDAAKLNGYRVTVKDLNNNPLCSSKTTTTGTYQCAFETTNAAAIPVSISVNGTYGQATAAASAVAGTPATITNTTIDLRVPITRVRFNGTVRDHTGAVVPNANVNIYGFANINTDAQGVYQTTDVLTNYTSLTNLDYGVSKNSIGVNVYQNATLNSGEVNTVSKDVVLPIAKLKLTGTVVTPGGSPVPNATITVTGSRYQTMTADSTGTYSSQDIEINASQTQTLQYKIRAGSATVERTVTVAPTALAELTQTENFIFDDTGPGSTVWSFTNPDSYTLNTPILAADGSIYVYSANGKVHAVNPDGSLRWTADVSASGLPMVGPNNVLYVPSGSSLIALNPDGGTRWRYSGASTINAMALANDGTIYLGSNRLVALDSSGAERWQNTSLTPTGNTVQSLIIRSDGSLAVVAGQYAQSTLFVLNPDGSTRWQAGGFQNSSQSGLIPGQDGAVFVIRSNGVTAFEEDGTQRWSTNINDYYDGIYPIGSLGSDGNIYVLSTRYYWGAYGSIKAINTQTGSINTIQVGEGYTAQLSIASNGAVLITLGTKFISLNDGVAQWTAESLNGNSFGDQPVVTSNGLVLVTAGSSLYAIRGDSLTGLDSSGWAHSRGNAQGTNQAPYVVPAPTRQVKLSGLVVDQNATSEVYVGAKVQVKDTAGKTLCRATSSSTGAYSCTINLTQTDQTTVNISAKPANVANTYPETSISHTVVAGAIGSSQESTINAQIRSTRLKVNGLITDAAGQPIPNVDVSLDYGYYSYYYGSGYNSSYGGTTTNANGEYSIVVNDMVTGTLPSDLTVRVSKTDFGPRHCRNRHHRSTVTAHGQFHTNRQNQSHRSWCDQGCKQSSAEWGLGADSNLRIWNVRLLHPNLQQHQHEHQWRIQPRLRHLRHRVLLAGACHLRLRGRPEGSFIHREHTCARFSDQHRTRLEFRATTDHHHFWSGPGHQRTTCVGRRGEPL
jgi:protocatechuate 3,4-dioxygenase beta subunit